ncbi:MAG TPA: N-methyl-D-aspartate receptor NMDAR2C subunit [Burkholderiales bacterium]|nr:N-methyl-D-aspartate receptor NMDAR2C subunit [Burkholderiales bacterium]
MGAPAPGILLYEQLIACYSEPHRAYHTLQHLEECFEKLKEIEDHAQHLGEVELALWFHDAVYDTRASDNEARSAQWAAEFLALHGTPEEEARDVDRAILATRHGEPPSTSDEALVVDLDLCILGSDDATYAAFEDAIRAEYLWVPLSIFRAKRAEILEGFVTRSAIYHHPGIRAQRESRARENVTTTIARLRGSG